MCLHPDLVECILRHSLFLRALGRNQQRFKLPFFFIFFFCFLKFSLSHSETPPRVPDTLHVPSRKSRGSTHARERRRRNSSFPSHLLLTPQRSLSTTLCTAIEGGSLPPSHSLFDTHTLYSTLLCTRSLPAATPILPRATHFTG